MSRWALLQRDLDAIFSATDLANAFFGVAVLAADTGEVLYRLNAEKLMLPASNMKIVTMAVAAERLGWDYRFETTLASAATIVDGVLQGDLVIVGSGDPTIGTRGGQSLAAFDTWATALSSLGVTRIAGRIIGDDDALDDERFGDGWAWDDFAFAYAAPVGALQFNQDTIDVEITAGAGIGSLPSVVLRPPQFTALISLETAAADTPARIELKRFPGSHVLELSGVLPANSGKHLRSAAVDNPTSYFAQELRAGLIERGVKVDGTVIDLDELESSDPIRSTPPGSLHVLGSYQSPPLREIGATLMKESQNLYAETLLKRVGAGPEPGSWRTGIARVNETLDRWGISSSQRGVTDGSGLSRQNYLTADMIARILRVMWLSPRHRDSFVATLPIAGKDGTLAERMKGTRAEGNVRAKTGTLGHVRALSGYLTTDGGTTLIFSMLANNYDVPTARTDAVMELAVERLIGIGDP